MTRLISERQLREGVVSEARRTRDRFPLAVAPTDLMTSLHLQLKEADLPDGKDGAYIENERTILINRKIKSTERRTFTLYHEITHHLIRNEPQLYSELHEFTSDNDAFDRTLEVLCNVGAAEFLLPGEYVRETIQTKGFALELLKIFCEDRGASIPAAAIQLAQYASHDCYIVVCELGGMPGSFAQTQLIPSADLGNSLFIMYTAASMSAKYSIARFTVIPKNHLIHNVHTGQSRLSGEDNIPFKSGKVWKVPCEAMYYKGRTIAIFNVTMPIDSHQLKLW